MIMGMYTEIYVNIDLVEDLPDDVLYVLKGLVRDITYRSDPLDQNNNTEEPIDAWEDVRWGILTQGLGSRFRSLFFNGSYYTPNTTVAKLSYDYISNQWSLLGKGDIKNYDGEIQQFFEWIAPYSETEFLGYCRYEEDDEPTLYYRKDFNKGE
jgi:hypothetical protein